MKSYRTLCLKAASCLLSAALLAGCGGASKPNDDGAQAGKGQVTTNSAAYLPGHAYAPQATGQSNPMQVATIPIDSGASSSAVMTASIQVSKPADGAGLTLDTPKTTASKTPTKKSVLKKPTDYRGVTGKNELSETWNDLIESLSKDIEAEDDIKNFFTGLEEFSHEPMGKKVVELFKYAYGKKPPPSTSTKPRPTLYTSIMTEAVASKCLTFLEENEKAFDRVEKAYDVPREIIVALLFIETRLGTYLGKDNALWSLACMAAASTPESVSDTLTTIPYNEKKHSAWLKSKLVEKSKWAYRELKALIVHCRDNKIDPKTLPGSIYGAIGICQFMPSNLKPYAVDGDNDGIIDLFNPADAIFSTANYLTKHGWKKDGSDELRHKTLKRYNNLNIYANSIIELSEAVKAGGFKELALARQEEESKKEVASPTPKTPAKKAPARKAPVKSNKKAANGKKA